VDLLRCALGLIPCGRLLPQTASELVMFATVVVLRSLVLATLAEAVLLQVAAMKRWRARRRRAVETDAGRAPGGRDVIAENKGLGPEARPPEGFAGRLALGRPRGRHAPLA